MQKNILFVAILVLIVFELFHNRQISTFSTELSPYKMIGITTKNVNVNEDVLVASQSNGKLNLEFFAFEAPLSKWFMFVIKKSGSIFYHNPIQIVDIKTDLAQVMASRKIFLKENMPVQYYIRFLDDNTYKAELNRLSQAANKKQQFDNCVAAHKGVNKSTVLENCKSFI